MTPRDRRRRVVLLCSHFMRNLAYNRAGQQCPRGWRSAPLRPDASFWRTAFSNSLDICVLEWCKLFGEKGGEHGWRKVVSDAARFELELLAHLGVSGAEFETHRLSMREYRDKFLAHLDLEPVMHIPQLDLAKASVEFYHAYLVAHECAPGDLAGLPQNANELKRVYRQSVEAARIAYRESQ
jgi:hypothetical protein